MDEISPGSSQSRPSISTTLSKQPFANPWDAEHEAVASDPITDQMMASYTAKKQLSAGSFNYPNETPNFNHILESSSQHSLHKSTDEIYAAQDPWTATTTGFDHASEQVQSPPNLYHPEAFATTLSRSQSPKFRDYTPIDEIRVSSDLI